MSIRFELRLTAICEECRAEWTPTQYTSLDNTQHILATECPRCAEERREGGRLLRYFPDDEILDLIN